MKDHCCVRLDNVPVPAGDGDSLVGVERGMETVQVGDVRMQAGDMDCVNVVMAMRKKKARRHGHWATVAYGFG